MKNNKQSAFYSVKDETKKNEYEILEKNVFKREGAIR